MLRLVEHLLDEDGGARVGEPAAHLLLLSDDGLCSRPFTGQGQPLGAYGPTIGSRPQPGSSASGKIISGRSPAPDPGNLVPLGVAGAPVADVEDDGEDHPEPVEAYEAGARRVDDHVDECREWEEDDAQKRQEKGVERGPDEDRPSDPHYEQRETREKSPEHGQQTTHPRYLLSRLAAVLHRLPRRTAMRKPTIRPFPPMARWRSIAKSFRSCSLFAPALHHAPEHKLRHGGGSSPRDVYPLGEIHPPVGDRYLPSRRTVQEQGGRKRLPMSHRSRSRSRKANTSKARPTTTAKPPINGARNGTSEPARTTRTVPKSTDRAPLPASSHPFSTSARSTIAESVLSTPVATAHPAMT